MTEGFRQGLQELGYANGQNVIVDYRFTEGQPDRIVGLAAELIQLRPDVLVVLGLLVMDAIKDVTGNTPISIEELNRLSRSELSTSPII
jgi:putative ABC transport system substrate-binding protein